MREYFFSPSTLGFYFSDLHDTMPDDVIKVTEERHAELIAGQEQGGRLVVDGKQVTLDYSPAPVDPEFLAVLARRKLDASGGAVIEFMERGKPVPAELSAYRATLRKIIDGDAEAISAGIPPVPDYPS